jgi:CBS domain-containing protein
MKVKDLMTREPRTCTPRTSAAEAAHLMWQADCGFLPIVEDGRLLGVVTDRDLYIALATRDRRASELPVGEVSTWSAFTCSPEDDVRAALQTMKRTRVRRLPVTVLGGHVAGILSIDDIMATAGRNGVPAEELVDALQALATHRPQPVAMANA